MTSLAPLLILVALQQTPQTTAIPSDTYATAATRTLVEQARAARSKNGVLISDYQATVSQRMGVGLQALARDRMLYRQEAVATINWHRDSMSTIEFLGAREGVPVAMSGDEVPNLRSVGHDLVIDPTGEFLAGTGSEGSERLLNPLGEGAELSYRYAIKDSITITLNTGKTIRIFGVEVTPRRSAFNLMLGTLWFDSETFNMVRAVYRPARPFESRRDGVDSTGDDLPGWVNVKFDVKFITIEYALFQSRWWMPTLIAFDGVGSMGAWLGVPFRMERSYTDYTVQGGTPADPNSTFVPAGRRTRTLFADPTTGDTASRAVRRARADSSLTVIVPTDTASLLTSPLLGAPILEMGDLISEKDLTNVSNALKHLPARPWETHVELPKSLGALFRGARYNRIEALSLGTNATVDFGRMLLNAEGRLGLADMKPNGEVSLRSASSHVGFTVAGYRRLAVANPDTKPFSAVNSMLALLAQRDDGEYYRTTGIEVTATNVNSGWWSVRVYHQRERSADVETQAALPHLFSNSQQFRPNFSADAITENGASLTLRTSHPFSSSLRVGLEATFDGAKGDYEFGRMAYSLRTFYTPTTGVNGALTLSAGTSSGDLPSQSAFILGGPASLRGYPGGATRGTAFWLARGEIARGIPGARLSIFSDIGWAGPREDRTVGHALSSVGVGASFLDGLVRIDLAHALQSKKSPQTRGSAWRLEFYIDGVL